MDSIIDNIRNSGLSPQTLSKRTGLDLQRVLSILRGDVDIEMSEIRKFSKALKVPPDFLISEPEKFPEINLLFRQAIRKDSDKHKADKISYLVGNVFSLIDPHEIDTSSLRIFPNLENSFQNARILAGNFRQLFCNSNFWEPLLYLPRIVSEELNCILFITDLGNDTDGASAIINGIPFIFISPRFEPRMLFTLAHELGHILSHHSSRSNFAKIDEEIVLGRNQYKDEAFANAFASELLMPEEGVGSALQTIRKTFKISGQVGDVEIIYLSRIYGVSFDVAAKRCEDLNLIPKGGAASLAEKIREGHINAEKRAKQLNIPERPKIVFPRVSPAVIESAISKINSGEISIGKASDILSIPMSEILNYKSRS